MADPTNVPLDAFVVVVKALFSQITELNVNVLALRAALMQQRSLPVSADELKRLHDFFREYEPLRRARETMENLGVDTSQDMIEFLKNFEGPIQ